MRRAMMVATVVLAACSGPVSYPSTEVMLIVDATSAVRVQTDHLQVEVSGATMREGPYGGIVVAGYGPPSALVGYPRRFGLVPADRDAKRFFEARAIAFDVHGDVLTEATVRSGYIEHELLELHIVLDVACHAVSCPDGQTCRHGSCQPVFVDPGMLPHGDAGLGDASGPEMGAADGGAPGDMLVPDGATPVDAGGDGMVGPGDAGCTSTSCDDGNECNGVEACIEGTCAPGAIPTCEDGVGCTTDVCTVGRGCQHIADNTRCTAGGGGTCDPIQDCQYTTCTASTCAYDPTTCTDGACSGSMCMRTPRCGAGQMCCAGACVAAGCDDGNACTDDACAGGCTHVNNTRACTDGIACTSPDVCVAGSCHGGASSCSDGNPCTDDICDHGTGACSFPANSNGCNDFDDCTFGDVCSGGACMSGGQLYCDDSNDCTDDVCGTDGACHHPNASAGSFCTEYTTCQMGTCSSGGCIPSGGGGGTGCIGLEICCNGMCGGFCG